MQGANNKDTDQTALMRMLICTFVVRIWHKKVSQDVARIYPNLGEKKHILSQNEDFYIFAQG